MGEHTVYTEIGKGSYINEEEFEYRKVQGRIYKLYRLYGDIQTYDDREIVKIKLNVLVDNKSRIDTNDAITIASAGESIIINSKIKADVYSTNDSIIINSEICGESVGIYSSTIHNSIVKANEYGQCFIENSVVLKCNMRVVESNEKGGSGIQIERCVVVNKNKNISLYGLVTKNTIHISEHIEKFIPSMNKIILSINKIDKFMGKIRESVIKVGD